MPSLSYQEKTLWGSLAAELIVYVPYFVVPHQDSIIGLAGTIFGIIVLQIILQAIIAAVTRNRRTDERDKLILLRGYRAGYIALVSMMVLGLGLLWVHAAFLNLHVENHRMGMHFLNVFFCMVVISDVVKTVAQLIAYRRDA